MALLVKTFTSCSGSLSLIMKLHLIQPLIRNVMCTDSTTCNQGWSITPKSVWSIYRGTVLDDSTLAATVSRDYWSMRRSLDAKLPGSQDPDFSLRGKKILTFSKPQYEIMHRGKIVGQVNCTLEILRLVGGMSRCPLQTQLEFVILPCCTGSLTCPDMTTQCSACNFIIESMVMACLANLLATCSSIRNSQRHDAQ